MKNSRITGLEEILNGTMLGCIFPGGIAPSTLSGDFGAMDFNRDKLRMMLDLMRNASWRPFCRQMLSVAPQWQGVKHDDATNERPDAMHHQVFRQIVGGIQLPDELVEIVRYWTGKWGVELHNDPVEGESFVVYNASDAPLLYVIALAELIQLDGSDAVLKDWFYHRPTGKMRTVAEAAYRCLNYVYNACLESEANGLGGFYAVPNTNPRQTSPTGKMEDGFDAVLRPVQNSDGSISPAPVDYAYAAYIDHQALAVWALDLGATVLFPNDERAPEWRKMANHLRTETLRSFWMDSSGTFGVAIDRQGLSELETLSALEVLNGTMLRGVKDAPSRVRALARWAYSPSVLTPIGPVMTSRKHQPLWGDYIAYQGPGSVWPIRTNTAVTGFANWGLPALVQDMGSDRNLGFMRRSGMALEATYVEPSTNTPVYDPLPASQDTESANIVIYASSPPQPWQGWTASAGLRQLWWERETTPKRAPTGTWQRAVEEEIEIPILEVPPASAMIDDPFVPLVAIDYERGENLKAAFATRLGLSA